MPHEDQIKLLKETSQGLEMYLKNIQNQLNTLEDIENVNRQNQLNITSYKTKGCKLRDNHLESIIRFNEIIEKDKKESILRINKIYEEVKELHRDLNGSISKYTPEKKIRSIVKARNTAGFQHPLPQISSPMEYRLA